MYRYIEREDKTLSSGYVCECVCVCVCINV